MNSENKGFLKRWKRYQKNQSGFTLMEMVIAIPLITLTGGFVVAVIGNSMTRLNENTLATNAGAESQLVIEKLKESRNCYELGQIIETDWEANSEIGSSNKANEVRNKFVIATTIVNTEGSELTAEECVSGTSNKIKVEAIKDIDTDNETLLYTTTTSVYVSE